MRPVNRLAQELTAALIKTQHIYSSHESGHSYEANSERALLLRHNFLADYQQLSKTAGRPPACFSSFWEIIYSSASTKPI